MNSRLIAVALLALFLGLEAQSLAQEGEGAWWNPFSKSSSGGEVRESSFFNQQSKGESWFKPPKIPKLSMPDWSGSKAPSDMSAQSKPSMFRRIGASSKRWWTKSIDFMNPFDSEPEEPMNGYQPQKLREQKSGGGMWSWMFPPPEPEPPINVNDFLSSPRPRF